MDHFKLHGLYDKLWNMATTPKQESELLKVYVLTRDIKNGCGLYHFSYHMLETITYHTYETRRISFSRYKRLLTHQMKGDPSQCIEPFGSWKDIKHFLTFFINEYTPYYKFHNRNDVVDSILTFLVIPQMIEDRKNMSIQHPITLCGKWLPRERSKKHGWLAKKIAILYYNHVICITHHTQTIYKHYRYLIRDFNKYLHVPQVHMCKNEWDKIQFEWVSAKTISKYSNAFLSDNHKHEPHRQACKENLQEYLKTYFYHPHYTYQMQSPEYEWV